MDIADRAQKDIETLAALAEHHKQEPTAKETGYCLFCGEPLEKGRRWCDAYCRDDWEKLNKMKGGLYGK